MIEEVRKRAKDLYKTKKEEKEKNRIKWILDMLEDNEAFSKMTSSVAFSILNELGLPIDKKPKELAIYITKMNKLLKIKEKVRTFLFGPLFLFINDNYLIIT